MIQRLATLTFLLVTMMPTLHANWKYSANRYDLRVASTSGEGTSPDGPIQSQLGVKYSPGKDGTMTIEFLVENVAKLKGFGFAAFEGPDAAAAEGKLTRIVVERTGAKPLSILTKVGGWYLGKAFVFAASEANAHPGDLLKAVRAIKDGATKVTVSVQDSSTAKKQLRADFTTGGAPDALAKLLK